MVYELWDVKFDIEKMRDHLIKHVLPLEATYQTKAFGGWSILSSNGSYQDGWHQGHKRWDPKYNLDEINRDLEKAKVKKSIEYVVPTEICHGYFEEVIKIIRSHGLNPHRARIIQLAAGLTSVWHKDVPENYYGVRLHIPIITNPGCFFEIETDRQHLPADGSAYFIYVNRMHRVVNQGETNRYHFVADVQDVSGVTQHHRYDDFIKKIRDESNKN